MNRKIVDSEFLINELQQRINEIPDVVNDAERIKVGGIQRMAELDINGCNWSPLISSANAMIYETEIREIVQALQQRYNVQS